MGIFVDFDIENADWPKRTDDRMFPVSHKPLKKEFRDHEHPRGDDGRFVDKADVVAAASNERLAAGLMRRVSDPSQRKLLVGDLRRNGMSDAHLGRAANLANWFGNSKIVDEHGNPKVLYHGTGATFAAFDPEKGMHNTQAQSVGVPMFYMTDNPEMANSYAYGESPQVLPVYVRMENPLVIDAQGREWSETISEVVDDIRTYRSESERRIQERRIEIENKYAYEIEFDPEFELPPDEQADFDALMEEYGAELRGGLQHKPIIGVVGYDGVIVKNSFDWTAKATDAPEEYDWAPLDDISPFGDVVIAFNPDQVKSASGNSGEYSRHRREIAKSFMSPLKLRFREENHPRGDDGRWVDKSRIEEAARSADAAAALMHQVTKPEQRAKLTDAFKQLGMDEATFRQAVDLANDPRGDYAKNGTRAASFRAWFGDWVNSPEDASKVIKDGEPAKTSTIDPMASKVVDKGGKPVVVYHGTPDGGWNEFDKSKVASANDLLYGPGFYFTEDVTVADDYTSKNSGPSRSYHETEFNAIADEIGEKLPGFYRIVQHPRQEGFGQYMEAVSKDNETKIMFAREDNDRPGKWLIEEAGALALENNGLFDAAGVLRERLPIREIKQVYLNIRKPVDIDRGVMDKQESERFIGLMDTIDWSKTPLSIPGKVASDFGDNVVAMAAQRGGEAKEYARDFLEMSDGEGVAHHSLYSHMNGSMGKAAANWVFQQMGYDGITHIGGNIMGGGYEHRVWIAFEPNQIKSVGNEGTFSNQTADIRKSFRGGSRSRRCLNIRKEFNRNQPRDDFGRWVKSGAIAEAAANPEFAEQLRGVVTDPGQRAKLDAAIAKADPVDTEVDSILDEPESEAEVELQGSMERVAEKMGWEPQDFASAVGAPDDSYVTVKLRSEGVRIDVEHDDIEKMHRTIRPISGGGWEIENDELFLKPQAQGKGMALEILSKQVAHASRLDVKLITTLGVRDDDEGWIGYAVWPKMGFDADTTTWKEGWQKRIDREFPGARSIQDIVDADGGAEWWKLNGTSVLLKFGLEKGSRSMRRLAKYRLSKKGARRA